MFSKKGVFHGNRAQISDFICPLCSFIISMPQDRTGIFSPLHLWYVSAGDNNDYILTYKSKGMMIREEYNLPLTKESYEHLKEKIDGRLITKKRYVIPLKDSLFIELDIFSGDLAPLMLAEVEFPDEETANHFTPPKWFGEDVTFSSSYHNSTLSKL